MTTVPAAEAKRQVEQYWNESPCGSTDVAAAPNSREYFDEIEARRYALEPEIFAFAQFSRHRGERVLEIGTGLGTDFIQWVRSGAEAYGVDLTSAAIEALRRRLDIYGLRAADIRVADCESLPFTDGCFDLVYAWGVIMHTPDTERALDEIVRVTRLGGRCKIMVYNRHSLASFHLWLRNALLRGRPWRSLSWCLAKYQESPGTKAFTEAEIRRLLERRAVRIVRVKKYRTYPDTLEQSAKPMVRAYGRIISSFVPGERWGWFLTIELERI
jgi:ubiquinone/menaquinone biosynthesis C-methylase UbiE